MNDLITAPGAPIRPAGHTGTTTDIVTTGTVSQEHAMSLIQEALARSHQQEAQRAAAQYRLARRAVAGRRWARLASWASARAERARLRAG